MSGCSSSRCTEGRRSCCLLMVKRVVKCAVKRVVKTFDPSTMRARSARCVVKHPWVTCARELRAHGLRLCGVVNGQTRVKSVVNRWSNAGSNLCQSRGQMLSLSVPLSPFLPSSLPPSPCLSSYPSFFPLSLSTSLPPSHLGKR
eukprot:217882-Rhodomonas_salina.1